jgi:hypothetical protein
MASRKTLPPPGSGGPGNEGLGLLHARSLYGLLGLGPYRELRIELPVVLKLSALFFAHVVNRYALGFPRLFRIESPRISIR